MAGSILANIYPTDIEFALAAHPAVAEAAVVGAPDPEFGEEIAAFVVTRQETPASELIAWCRESVAAYKVPKFIYTVPELPRNSAGKVLKAKLIQQATSIISGDR